MLYLHPCSAYMPGLRYNIGTRVPQGLDRNKAVVLYLHPCSAYMPGLRYNIGTRVPQGLDRNACMDAVPLFSVCQQIFCVSQASPAVLSGAELLYFG